MLLPVTIVIAAACGLINIWLAARTSQVRLSDKVEMGDGGNARVIARMRAHANFTENAPFVLILMALIELAHGSPLWLWVAGVTFVLSRLAHAFGMARPSPNPLRIGGISVSMLVLLCLSIWAVLIGYQTPAARPAAGPVSIGPPPAA